MEATLEEILACREHRAKTQKEILSTTQSPLICLTLNIPGPQKTSPLIFWGFRYGLSQLKAVLTGSGMEILACREESCGAGDTAYLTVRGDCLVLKKLCAELEDRDSFGRLLDLDVLTPSGTKVSREELGLPQRTCLLCGKPAFLCGRSRAHTLESLRQRVRSILEDTLFTVRSEAIASLAVRSLLLEVSTTPKPGLVDRNNPGSHEDMDLPEFFAGSTALFPYFARCARIGMETASDAPSITFARLRLEGKLAERAMYAATGGVNTHKGAIFILGIFCAAAARLTAITEDALFETVKAMAQGLCAECGANQATIGQRLFAAAGITGIRGQAEAGFPAVQKTGLTVLRQGLARGLSLNDAGRCALLHILCNTEDTSFLHRCDRAICEAVLEEVAAILRRNPFPEEDTLLALDRRFMGYRLSPGGSADLLAATYFTHFLLIDTGRFSGIMKEESKTEKEYFTMENEEILQEEETSILTLVDEKGQDVDFEYLDCIEYQDKEYLVLVPVEEESNEIVILEVQPVDEETENYVAVEDEAILDTVYGIFKERYKDVLDFAD